MTGYVSINIQMYAFSFSCTFIWLIVVLHQFCNLSNLAEMFGYKISSHPYDCQHRQIDMGVSLSNFYLRVEKNWINN